MSLGGMCQVSHAAEDEISWEMMHATLIGFGKAEARFTIRTKVIIRFLPLLECNRYERWNVAVHPLLTGIHGERLSWNWDSRIMGH